MTQNTALSLIGAIVIAVGFLVGWCAGALELVPAPVKAMATTGASDRSTLGSPRIQQRRARSHPVRSESTARDSL